MRVAEDVFEMMLVACVLRLGAVLRHVQPALDEVLVGFQVELEAIRAIAESKRLVRAGGCAGQVHGSRRKVERVGVPLEYMLLAIEVTAEGVSIGRGRGILETGCEVLVLSNEEVGLRISDRHHLHIGEGAIKPVIQFTVGRADGANFLLGLGNFPRDIRQGRIESLMFPLALVIAYHGELEFRRFSGCQSCIQHEMGRRGLVRDR